MSTLFTITSGNLTDSIFARTISDADTTSVSAVMGIGTTPVDITTFLSDGSSIWGVSFNVKSRSSNPTGLFSCKLFDSFNVEQGSLIVPISNFPAGDGSNNIDSIISQSWQTLKFDDPISTSGSYYIRLSANTDGELYFYGLPQLDQTVIDYGSGLDVVATGNATQNTFNPYNTNAWSVFMNDGAHITHASNTAFNLSTRNFTIDFWCYFTEIRTHRIVSLFNLNIDVSNSNTLVVYGVNTTLSVPQNNWVHIAVTRTGDVLNGYVNGVKSNNISLASNFNFSQGSLFLGRDRTDPAIFMHGHIYNFRIVLNQALYSTNFTKPTSVTSKVDNGGAEPSTPPSEDNVQFLILDGKNYLEGVNRKLVNGSLTLAKPVSPYNTYWSYANLDFSKLRIDTPLPDPGTGDFTIETWWMPYKNSAYILDFRVTSGQPTIVLYLRAGSLKLFTGMSDVINGAAPALNTWHHVALVKTSNIYKLYLNGAQTGGNYTSSIIVFNPGGSSNQMIGGYYGATGGVYSGSSFANFRVTNTAVYTGNFTPPDLYTPLPSIPGTQLLLNFNNKNNQIFENNSNANLKIWGQPVISNTASYRAIWFDGVDDMLSFPLTWDANTFTVQMDIYLPSDQYTRVAANIFTKRDGSFGPFLLRYEGSASTVTPKGINLWWGTSTSWYLTRHNIVPLAEVPLDAWFNITLVYENGTLKTYFNGLNKTTVAVASPEMNDAPVILGYGRYNEGLPYFFGGAIKNFAVHNSAIYTSNFNPVSSNYYLKDALFWIEGKGNKASDVGQTHSQFIDNGPNNRAITLIGIAVDNPDGKTYEGSQLLGTSTTKNSYAIGPNNGNFPNVTLDYILYPSNEKYYIETSTDFTIESWVKTNSKTTQGILTIANGGLAFGLSGGKPYLGKTYGPVLLSSASALNADWDWNHLAITRSSGNLSLFINGRLSATRTNTTEFSAGPLRIAGDFNNPINIFDGYLADIRLTKGQALYTTTFTPPTASLTINGNGGASPSINPLSSNILLLEANNPASNPTSDLTYPVLNSGAVITQAPSANFSPFTAEEVYNTSTHGGSIYFDGTGDLVSVSEKSDEFTFGTGDFTTEFWYYPTAIDANDAPLLTWEGSDVSADGLNIKFTSSTNLQVLLGNDNTAEVTLDAPGTYLNQWSHIALTRNNNTYRLFVNGQLVKSAFYTGLNLSNQNDKLKIGQACRGYISDVRVTKTQALYTDYFTPPTASLTLTQNGASGPGVVALTATPNLLIKGTTAGIYDGSANNAFTLSGATFKVTLNETINANYADNTLIFNGVFNNNFILIPPSPSLNLAGDFWIDFWMNSSKFKHDTEKRRILTLGNQDSVSAFQVCINVTGSDKKLQILSNTNILSSNFEYADGAWHHVGIGRSGSTLSLYRDGIFDRSVTNNLDFDAGVSNNSFIGIYGAGANPKTGRYGGKLVGLRIINGECVHTSNYTIPTSPATLTSDGGEGTNEVGNVSLFMKLNNIVSPVNNHVITSEVQSLTGAISNPKTGNLTFTNIVTSSRALPARSRPGTTAAFINVLSGSAIDFSTLPSMQLGGDWTIEGWFYPLTGTSDNGDRSMISFYYKPAVNREVVRSYLAFSNNAYFAVGPWGTLSAAGNLNAYSHVALCKRSNDVSLYVAGTRTATSTAQYDSNFNIISVGDYIRFGGGIYNYDASSFFQRYHGDIYNVRIIDGRAIYNGNFTVPAPSSISATADTCVLFNDAKQDIYYRPGHLEKVVIGGSISNENVIDPITITTSLSYWALNNVSIQNYGTFTSPTTSNNTFNITNNGLKIGSGGTFILSSAPGYRKVLNMDESRIHVLAGGALDIRGQQKTIKATLTGDHTATRSVFTLNETPTNWLSGDSLIFLPPSANNTQFEELSTKSVLTNRLSTTTNSLYAHQYLAGIPSIANATRNFAIKGLSTNRRGWLQFDKTSNTYICDTEFEHLGRSTSKKVGSIVLNVKPGGSFLLSGCYLDGSTSTGVDATTLYGRSNNVTIRDNVFYKYSGNAFAFNNIADNFNINDNIILRSGKNGIKLQNATLGGTCNLTNNISLGNTERGTYIENVDGNIEGSANWYNTLGGLYLAKPTTGENKDMSDEDIEITEEATTNLVSFDTPLSEQYPDETSTFPFTKRLIWPGNSKYIFLDDFTIEAFLKFSVNNTNAFNLMGNYSEAELGAIILSYQSNTQTFRLKTYESTFTTRASATLAYLPINTWHHIAICRKDDSISVYLNGSRIMLYNSSFEYKATDGGIALGWDTDLTNKGVYGFRILNRAQYDSVDTITVPSTPFVFDNKTLLLYKRTVKTGVTKINNILNNINGVGGMFIDNNSPSLKNTTISNISCTKNTGYGISIDGSNVDYREANSLTAIDILTRDNNTIGLNLNNMTGVLTGVLAIDNSTTNIQLKLGDGITKVKSVTGLVASNIPNMIIYSSKSFRPVIFDDIYLNKNTTMTSAYSAVPLHIRETDFLNFHFDNSTLAAVSTGFAVTLSGTVLGTYQFSNTVTTDAGVQNLSCLPPDNIKSGGIIFMNKNKNKGSHESFYRKGKRATDTSVVAGNIAEKITPSSLTDRFKSGSKFAAVSSGDTVTLRMKVTTTVNGDARLMLKKNSSLGFDDDVLLYPISNSSTFTTTSPSASGVGIMEFFVDCTGTTGSVIIDDWKAK